MELFWFSLPLIIYPFFLLFNLILEFATGKGYLFCLVMDKLNQHNSHVIK